MTTVHNPICRANHLITVFLADCSSSLDEMRPGRLHELAKAVRDAGEAIAEVNASPQQDVRVFDVPRAYGSNLRLLRDELAAAVSRLRERRERVLQEQSQMAGAMAWVCAGKWFEG